MLAIQGVKNANEQNKIVSGAKPENKPKATEEMIIGGEMPKFEDDD